MAGMRSEKSGVLSSKQPSRQSSQIGGSEEDPQDDSQDIDYEEDEDELEVSQKEVKEELLLAIADAIQQHEEQITINNTLQRKVILFK